MNLERDIIARLTFNEASASVTIKWPSTVKYQPVHNLSSLNAQLSQLDLFSFYNSFGESVCLF